LLSARAACRSFSTDDDIFTADQPEAPGCAPGPAFPTADSPCFHSHSGVELLALETFVLPRPRSHPNPAIGYRYPVLDG